VKLARSLDLIVLALALVVFVVAGLPILAWVAIAVAWIAQRVVNQILVARAEAEGKDAARALNFVAVGVVSRAWIPGIAALVVGLLTDRETGFAAVVLAVVVFTVHFVTNLVLHADHGGRQVPVQHPSEGQS
jgi:hypothetical protein